MDVLAYSAFNQQVTLNQQIASKTSCLSTKCSETAARQAVAAGISTAATCWVQCIEPCLLRVPQTTSFWACIPELTGASQGLKVCRCSGNNFFNYGACCLWTVPSGITRARFQLWGAGGGSGGGCCCGGSAFGSTGAYASVIIPVTAGDTYTLCSGCANQNRACSLNPGNGRFPGCPSFVVGNGLCNFCANGGQGRLGNWMAQLGKISGNDRISSLVFTVCGPSIRNSGVDYCYVGTSCTGNIQHVPGASYFGTTTSASSPSIVYGIRGMWPCMNTFNYGGNCHVHPPIYGFPTTSCCGVYYNSTCCGITNQACCGVLQVPGAGGWPTNVTGGSTSICGDWGRGGMVCVTFC